MTAGNAANGFTKSAGKGFVGVIGNVIVVFVDSGIGNIGGGATMSIEEGYVSRLEGGFREK